VGDVIVLALVGIGSSLVGAYVSGRVTARVARQQTQRERRVEMYTDLLPEVLPALESGKRTTADARALVERIVREAAATSPEDRTRARAALVHIRGADGADKDYSEAQQKMQTSEGDDLRHRMEAAATAHAQQIAEAGARLREYSDWLDGALG
jgi:hypothetical protein